MKILKKISQTNDKKREIISISITVTISILLTILGIYGLGEYGIAIFILIPFFLGFCPTILYGYENEVTKMNCRKVAFLSLTFFMVLLLLFAIEGLICVFMALPLALLFSWIGSLIGFEIIKRKVNNGPTMIVIFIFLIPTFSFVENQFEPKLKTVRTAITIKASREKVWENVVEFPQLKKPSEFIFKTGIAYPINATIKGKGIGAIRYCNFTTGSFVEPITTWDKPKRLAFDVEKQPIPMKELSIWDIDAPHLHDYFISKKGEFRLLKLKNGDTQLIGTTWYYNDIKPTCRFCT